jgi:hypothetical protein
MLKGGVAEAVAALKREGGRDLLVMGSPERLGRAEAGHGSQHPRTEGKIQDAP